MHGSAPRALGGAALLASHDRASGFLETPAGVLLGHYASGNALRLARSPYDAEDTSARLARVRETYTREFFAERDGAGFEAPDPMFIVGLPRAGSTLIEQILASHPLVEGTMELPEITSITRSLRRAAADKHPGAYHDALAGMNGVMPVIRRLSDAPYRWKVEPAPLSSIANHEKKMPPAFIRKDGYGITAACRRYLSPLVRGEAPTQWRPDGLPAYETPAFRLVPRRLPRF